MRNLVLASLLIVGCSSATDPNNRGSVPTEGNYPLGPYGYAKGSVIANLQFQAKIDPMGAAGTAAYANLDPQTVNLSDYFQDNNPDVGWLVLTGAAGWCGPCREEAQKMPADSLKWEPMGVRFLTVLIQGFDETDQTPATPADIDNWQQKTKEHIGIGFDPKDNLHDFASEIASFPLNMLVRTADMAIIYTALGVDPNNPSIDPILSAYVQ
jgi:thiol-disulfide isomerase/thioredoxin